MRAVTALHNSHGMTSRILSDHPPSNPNTGDGRRQSTAYRGASHAFSLAVPAQRLPNASISTNGALAAATSAGTGMRRQGVQLAEGARSDGDKNGKHSTKTARQSDAWEKVGSSREQSPSYAAALYASSQKSVSSTPDTRQPPLFENATNRVKAPSTIPRSTDETIGGATSSLVSLFESKQNFKKDVPITQSIRYATKPTPAITSPTPVKPLMRSRMSSTSSRSTLPNSLRKETAAAAPAAQTVGRIKADTTSTYLPHIVPEPLAAHRRSYGHAPPGAIQEDGSNLIRNSKRSTSLAISQAKVAEPSTTIHTTLSDPAILPSKPSSAAPSCPLLPVRSSRSFDMKVNSLANTIVAASLASSRAPSPTKTQPPPPHRNKSHSLFHSHHTQAQSSRTPSPAKAMRQTMREPLTSEDDMEYKKKSLFIRTHPHKHHEGDRKRYRATVTEVRIFRSLSLSSLFGIESEEQNIFREQEDNYSS